MSEFAQSFFAKSGLALLLVVAALSLSACGGGTDRPKTPEAAYDALQAQLMAGRWDRGFDYLSARAQSQLISGVAFMIDSRLVDTEGQVPSSRWVFIHPKQALQIVAPLSGDFDGIYITPEHQLLERKEVKGRTLLRYQYRNLSGELRQRWIRFAVEEGVWRVDIDLTAPGDIVDTDEAADS